MGGHIARPFYPAKIERKPLKNTDMWIFQDRLSMDWECNLTSIELITEGNEQIDYCNYRCTELIGMDPAPAYIMLHTDASDDRALILIAVHATEDRKVEQNADPEQVAKYAKQSASRIYEKILDGMLTHPNIIDLRYIFAIEIG